MTDNPPTLRQLLHEFTADYALLDEPLEFTYTEWSHGTAELARCVVTGLTVRQFKGRLVQTLKYEDAEAEHDDAGHKGIELRRIVLGDTPHARALGLLGVAGRPMELESNRWLGLGGGDD